MVTLLNMYSVIMQVKATANIQYSSFMDLYEFVTSMEFLLLMFIVPAVTASSISGGAGTPDLRSDADHPDECRTDRRREAVECFKHTAFAHPFQFPGCCNGIRIWGYHMGRCFLTDPLLCDSGIFAGSIGICFSAALKRSTISTVVTYGTLVAVVAGTYFINRFALSISGMSLDKTTAYSIADSGFRASSGVSFYLFLFNPAVTFMAHHWGNRRAEEHPCRYSKLFLECREAALSLNTGSDLALCFS